MGMAFSNPTEKPGHDVAFRKFVQNVNGIERKLGRSLHSKNANSVVCVPSAQILLGLLYAGAGGKTASELGAFFGDGNKQPQTIAFFKEFISQLQVPEIKIATTAYVAEDLALKEEFVAVGENVFDASVKQFDFTNKAESAKTINAWVEAKTEKLIRELFTADDIDDNVKLILLNAIYFKAKWARPFHWKYTENGPFHVSANKKVTVKHMSQEARFPYAQDADYKYLIMPYQGSTLSMLIVLPKDIGTFEKKDISKVNLSAIKFKEYRVAVRMPKFKVESTIDWGSILKPKIPSAFDISANLTGVSDCKLVVSKIIQKAFIKVDEEGTEAAAATGAAVIEMCGPIYAKEFIVDRPFYYFIQADVASQQTFLFQGVVTEPSV